MQYPSHQASGMLGGPWTPKRKHLTWFLWILLIDDPGVMLATVPTASFQKVTPCLGRIWRQILQVKGKSNFHLAIEGFTCSKYWPRAWMTEGLQKLESNIWNSRIKNMGMGTKHPPSGFLSFMPASPWNTRKHRVSISIWNAFSELWFRANLLAVRSA